MPRVTCAFCGLPFSVRTVREGADCFCCSGCALASRIPVQGDRLPVSRELVLALVLGFGLFNELLFAVLGAAVTAEGRVDAGEAMRVISIAVGALLLTAGVGLLARAQPRHWTDVLAALPALGVAAWALWCALRLGPGPAVWAVLSGNLWLAAWLSRGWVRRAWRRRRPASRGRVPVADANPKS